MEQITRGTSCLNTFETDTDLSDANEIYVTYRQHGRTIIEKTMKDITVTEDSVEVTLTQEETLNLDAGGRVAIQIRADYEYGSAIASNIMFVPVNEILKEGPIHDEIFSRVIS